MPLLFLHSSMPPPPLHRFQHSLALCCDTLCTHTEPPSMVGMVCIRFHATHAHQYHDGGSFLFFASSPQVELNENCPIFIRPNSPFPLDFQHPRYVITSSRYTLHYASTISTPECMFFFPKTMLLFISSTDNSGAAYTTGIDNRLIR